MAKKDKQLKKALAGRTSIGPKAIANIQADLGIKGGVKAAAKDLGINIKGTSGGSGGSNKQLQQALAGRTSIGPKAIEKIQADLDIKGGVRTAARDLGINIKGGASVPSSSASSESGLTPPVFDYQGALNLLNQQGNIDTQIANINSDASRYISELQVGVSRDVANIEADATRYVADRGLESDLGVENIRAKGAVDLQKIVNAGMERVENVRGEFGVKGKKIDRSTAILSGLVSAFNF